MCLRLRYCGGRVYSTDPVPDLAEGERRGLGASFRSAGGQKENDLLGVIRSLDNSMYEAAKSLSIKVVT